MSGENNKLESGNFKLLNLSLKKYTQSRNRYKRCYAKWRDNRRMNITNIRLLIIGLENTKHKCNITSLSSGVGGVVGGVLTGVGLITIPFSMGATTPLFISGAAVLVGSGVTGLGGAAADIILSRSKCKEAQTIINRDVELTTELQLLEQEYAKTLEVITVALRDLETNHPDDYSRFRYYVTSAGSSAGGAFGAGSSLYKVVRLARVAHLTKVGKLTLTSSHLIEQVNPIPFMSVGAKMDDVIEAGGQAGVVASRGAKIGMIAAAALVVVGLAIDVTSIVYNSRQIHLHRKNQRDENSSSATNLSQTEDAKINDNSDSESLLEDTKEQSPDKKTDETPQEKEGFFKKLKQKVTHSFTRNYISENAEQLKKYVEKLETELFTMENNASIQDLVFECNCRECTPIGGGVTVHCCHQDSLYWNSVRIEQPIPTHNTPSLCVTQHPAFAQYYLNVENLQKHFPHLKQQQTTGKFKSHHRTLRFSVYILFTRNSTQLDGSMKIPDCVHRAVVHAFQPETQDIWENEELGTKLLWKDTD